MRNIGHFLLALLLVSAGSTLAQTSPASGFSLAQPYAAVGFSSSGFTIWGGADSVIMDQIGLRAGVGFWSMGAMGVSATLFGVSVDGLYEFEPMEFAALQRPWSFRPHAGAGLRFRTIAGVNQVGASLLAGYTLGASASAWALLTDFGIGFLTNRGMAVDFDIGFRYRF